MPVMFAITVGACVSLVAVVMFGLAWYEYETRVVLKDQVLDTPTHDEAYNSRLAEQEANLGDIDQAVAEIAAEHAEHNAAGHATH